MGIARYLSKLASGLSSEGVVSAAKGGTGTTSGGGSGSGGPKISSIVVTNSSYTNLDDTAVDIAGGYVKIIGSGFETGCQVLIGSTLATSVTFVSATEVRAQVPATAAGTYIVYLVNSDGGTAIRVNGVTFSTTPTWTSTSPIAGIVSTAISIQLTATGASTFSIAAGSTLPAGLTLSSSGLLSGIITGITQDTTYNFTILATDTELQDSPQTFALNISAAKDPYFNYTTLLLPGASTTFVDDASTNNFAVTIAGDTKPNSFNPYTPGYYSNYFDGNGDYLSVADSAAFTLSGDFTIECWLYPTSHPTAVYLIGQVSSTDYAPVLLFLSNGQPGIAVSSNGSTWTINGFIATALTLNTWSHVAAVRSGNKWSIYVNGVENVLTASTAVTPYNSTDPLGIGSEAVATINYPYIGYISNLRIVNGTAVYTSNFTPSTTPLTAISGTSLLTCQSNRFIDTSTNNFTITKVGDTKISSFDPFVPNASYSTYGSAYFDGTGDYLYIPSNAALGFGTGDFTFECWVHATAAPPSGGSQIFDTRPASTNGAYFLLYLSTSLTFNLWVSSADRITSSAVPLNAWNHVAVVRSGGTTKMYVNGVQSGSNYTDSTNYLASASFISASYGGGAAITNFLTGYIADVRVVKGTAVYTTAFTPPTTPLTPITNTSLLTLQNNQSVNNSTFLDSSSNNFAITRAGNTTQGTFSPYGANWSNYFDGTGDYLTHDAIALGSTFTIECWIYKTNTSSTFAIILGNGAASWFSVAESGLVFSVGGSTYSYTGTFLLNTWNHIALVNNAGTLSSFINGIKSVTTYTGMTSGWTQTYVGQYSNVTAYPFAGYISNLRVINGTAVYTATFNPPTSPLTAVTNTQLLTCVGNRLVDSSTNNFTITKNGDVSIQRFSPFSPSVEYAPSTIGGSAYFDGTGDYLTVAPNTQTYLSSGAFTMEAWVYPAANNGIIVGRRSAAAARGILFGFDTSNAMRFWAGDSEVTTWNVQLTSTATYPLNQWYHVAVTRNSSNVYNLWVNGTSVATATSTFTIADDTSNLQIGTIDSGSGPFNGYISDLRIVKGTALYTSNFTPPAQQLTAVQNTSLLCNFTSAGVYDATMLNNLETVGDAKLSTAVSKFGGSSMSFDGTGDYLICPDSLNQEFDSGNLTWEMWVNTTNLASFSTLYSRTPASFSTGMWALMMNHSASSAGDVALYIGDYSTTGPLLLTTGVSIRDGNWHHVAVVRNGSAWAIYVDGTSRAIATWAGTIANIAGNPYIGADQFYGRAFNGYIDDLRITKGVARYTSNFTAPAIAHLTK